MADVLLDVNIAVDLCMRREPHGEAARRAYSLCRQAGWRVWLYTGSLQTLVYVTAAEVVRYWSGEISASASRATAHQLVERLSRDVEWLAALAEDGTVFGEGDPIHKQLTQAVSRLGSGAVLLTRDAELLSRCKQGMTPTDFIEQYEAVAEPAPPALVDLGRQLDELRPNMERAVWTTIQSTKFINGPPIELFEEDLAEFTGVTHAIGCSSGTDAIILALMALGVQRGDEVIVPDFSFIATAETVALMGAKPVFIDIRPDTFNIDPDAIEAAISDRTVGIIPVSLYGQPADMDEINAIAKKQNLWVMEDAAQSCGATYKGQKSGSLSRVAATSFFPAKPLGCYGDGGAVFTDDDELAANVRMILNHGQRQRYDHAVVGLNARLDTLQASILRVKLATFKRDIERRHRVADWYEEALSGADDSIRTPVVLEHNRSTWAQYTVRVADRPSVQAALKKRGIATSVHYPIPLHRQDALAEYATGDLDTPNSVRAAEEVLSLPMHPYLSKEDVGRIAEVMLHG